MAVCVVVRFEAGIGWPPLHGNKPALQVRPAPLQQQQQASEQRDVWERRLLLHLTGGRQPPWGGTRPPRLVTKGGKQHLL